MISRKRGMSSLAWLVDNGMLTPDQAKPYEQMVVQGLSYKQLMLGELGAVIGELYCREEEAQALVKLDLKIDLQYMSIPEILVVEDGASSEPHHREHYSELTTKRKFEEECGEPWHVSLRERFQPDKRVAAWFKARPELRADTERILRIAYSIG